MQRSLIDSERSLNDEWFLVGDYLEGGDANA